MGPVEVTGQHGEAQGTDMSGTDQLRIQAGTGDRGISALHPDRTSPVGSQGTNSNPASRSRLTRQTCPQSRTPQWNSHLHRDNYNQGGQAVSGRVEV
jgi:hypothetical protein